MQGVAEMIRFSLWATFVFILTAQRVLDSDTDNAFESNVLLKYSISLLLHWELI